MKLAGRKFAIVLILILSFFIGQNLVFAETEPLPGGPVPGGDEATAETPSSAQNSGQANREAIPGTFNVRENLSVPGQSNRLLPQPQGNGSGQAGGGEQELTGIAGFLVRAINLFVEIVASISLIVFIIGGLLTITSEGKEDRIEKGKNAMVYAIIGLAVTFFAFIIVTFVQSILF